MPTYTIFTGKGATNSWTDPNNWGNGVPQPGEFVGIDGSVSNTGEPTLSFDSLGLSHMRIFLRDAYLQGTNLGLSHTVITATSFSESNLRIYNVLSIDQHSFVGVAPDLIDATLDFSTPNFGPALKNLGTIGAESGGGSNFRIEVETPTPGSGQASGQLDNDGRIVARNGGTVSIYQENIEGNGSIDLSHGGVLALGGLGSIAASQRLYMGGQSATTLEFSPRVFVPSDEPFSNFGSEIDAEIRGFAKTDLINIQSFAGSIVGVTASGNDDTTVSFEGTVISDQEPSGVPVKFGLKFEGAYKHSDFSLHTSAGGEFLTSTHG